MEPAEGEPTAETVRLAQKAVGAALWLTTRARPDTLLAVSRMGAAVTRSPDAVLQVALQLKGYLKITSNEGLKFQTQADEHPVPTVYTDVSPDSQESHGAFIVFPGNTPVFWRSGRQGLSLFQLQRLTWQRWRRE